MEEVRKRVQELRKRGLDELVLQSLLHPDDVVSTLHITKDYRIFLPEYQNMEIEMTPLPKAVFLLYLRHPEGIAFKQLADYYDELFAIYGRLSGREDKEQVQNSIRDIVDPTKNSINEKCARIREAFVRKFDERLARNYYITGKRAEPKRIILDRSLVVWK